MKFVATHPESHLQQISTEFILPPDYGGGHKYSIFEHPVACAQWLRSIWNEQTRHGTKQLPPFRNGKLEILWHISPIFLCSII